MPHFPKASIPFQVVTMILLFTAGSIAQPVDSFGRGVPLGVAIQRIVPEGTSVKVVPSSLEERRVSWTAGSDWRQVLRRAAQGAGLRVREEGGVVIIEAPPPPPAQPTARPVTPEAPGARGLPGDQPLQQSPGFVLSSTQTGGAGSSPSVVREEPASSGTTDGQRSERQTSRSEPSVVRQGQSRSQSSPQRATSSEQGVWRAQRGQTLDQVLSEWSERAGWTLVFNTPIIYEIQAGAELRGDFIDAAASLINSIQARPLPRAVFYKGNRVLVVSNSFEASSP